MSKSFFCILMFICSALSFVSTLAQATPKQGVYFGGGLFYYQHDVSPLTAIKYQIPGLDFGDHIGGQLFIGYQLNKYLAIQGGYLLFANNSSNNSNSLPFINTPGTAPDHLRIHAFDALLKGILPLCSWFDLHAEGGAAYVTEDNLNVPFNGVPALIDSHVSKLKPIMGAGFSIYPAKWVSIDTDAMYIPGGSKISSFTFFPISLTFHIS